MVKNSKLQRTRKVNTIFRTTDISVLGYKGRGTYSAEPIVHRHSNQSMGLLTNLTGQNVCLPTLSSGYRNRSTFRNLFLVFFYDFETLDDRLSPKVAWLEM